MNQLQKNIYQIIEGSILDINYRKFNLDIYYYVGTAYVFAISYYGGVYLKYDPYPNCVIVSYNDNVTFHSSIPSFSELIAFKETSYNEDYWKLEIVFNFESYDEIICHVNEYDLNNPAYIVPWIIFKIL